MRPPGFEARLSRAVDALGLGDPWRLLAVLGCFALLSQLFTAARDAIPSVGLPTVSVGLSMPPISPAIVVGAWMSLNLGLAVVAMVLVARALATPGALGLSVTLHAPPTTPAVVAGVLCTLAFVPLTWGLLNGHPVGFTLLLSAIAFLALARGQDRAGGISLALLAPLGIQLVIGPAALLVAQRRWSALGTLGACTAALAVLSVPLVGFDRLVQHVLPLTEMSARPSVLGTVGFPPVSLHSWVARVPVVGLEGGAILSVVLTVATLLIVGLAWRRRVSGGRVFARAYLCFSAVGLLCGFHTVYQDLVVLLPVGFVAVGLDRVPARHAVVRALNALRSLRRRRHVGSARLMRLDPPRSRTSQWPGLMLVGVALIVVIPGVAWMVVGPYSLTLVPLWANMVGPALALVTISALPATIADEIRLPAGWRGGQTAPRDASALGRSS